MSIQTRFSATLTAGVLLLGTASGCTDAKSKSDTAGERSASSAPSATTDSSGGSSAAAAPDAGVAAAPDAGVAATPDAGGAATSPGTDRAKNAAPSSGEPLIIYADCHAPHRWTWGWTLNVKADGKANVDLKPDAYGEDAFEDFKISPEKMNAIRKAAEKARFFELDAHYGDPEGPVTRKLKLKIGDREHETSFTARHTELDGIPVPLLELWVEIRNTFNTYRAHDGAEYIQQYLEGRGYGDGE